MNFFDVISSIEEFNVITLYHHIRPDCDAQGAQYGMKEWLQLNFPEKKIYALGNEYCNQREFPTLDIIDDKIIQDSLAIVLDTANRERIDDQRYILAKKIIKIDHHPNLDPFGDIVKVYEEAAATCEILAEFFNQMKEKYKVNNKCAEYLYSGLLTDTLCFRTSNTTSHTLKMASFLTLYDINISDLNRDLFDQTIKSYQFANYLRTNIIILNKNIAYKIITQQEQQKWEKSASEARSFIDELGHVKEFEVWALFTERIENNEHVYDGSLRSKKIQLNDIAREYQGGGHKNACGVKNLSSKSLNTLLQKIQNRLDKNKNN